MAEAPRSNPYLAQQSADGRGQGELVEDGRSGPKAPPADGALGEASGTGAPDGAQRTRASFVRRSFSRRSTVGAASEGSFSSQGGSEYDPPSAMEIIEYAKYLGMNPIYDADLLWIAAEGLTAPLPAGWTEHEDQDGNLYFYNTATDHSTREHPLDKHYRQTYLNEKRKKDQLTGASEDTAEEKKGGKGFGGLFSKNKGDAAPENPPPELNLPLAEDPLATAPSAPGTGSAPTTAEGSEPTLVLVPADIRDMAVYLGIHIRTESDMLWIARESLTASLPPRWEELEDEAGHPYYYNLVTGTTTRKHPLDHYFVQLAKFERYNPERKRQPAEAWMDFVDSQGRTYYYNFSNDQTTYDRPANVIDDDTIRWFSVGKKAQLENYLATRIQAAARGRQARKRLSALKNLDTLRDLLAAKKIQYAWRTRVAARYVKRWHDSVARGMAWGIWRHRAKARSSFQEKVRRSEAALTIQRYWRGHMTRAYVGHVKNRLQEMKAALKIQAAWRGASTRKRVKKTKAAIKTRKIQDDARQRRLREERVTNYHEQLAVKQKKLWQLDSWKKWCVALEPRVEFQAKVKRIRAAVKIQKRARAWIMHRRVAVHAERVQRFQFVTRLQAKWRGIGARRRFKYAKAATQIQSVWRGRKIRMRFVKELASLRIQCVWRGYVVRKHFGRFLAARVIQASWRGFWGRKQFQLQYSARKIQSLWRGYVARRAFRAHYAAGTIQKCWRGFAIRKQGLLLQEIQKRTAVKIQAHYRGYLTRRSLKRATQEEAVIRIQRGWRRVRERRRAKALKQKLREQEAAQHSAATTIQAHQRSKMARSYAASERQKVREARENLAAREIQRVARGKHARERLRREREAAIAVQRELATITIQRVHRGRQGRKVYHSKRQEQAATKIQAASRRKAARATVAAIRHQKQVEHNAAVSIQCFWRRKMSERALERRKAARRLEKRRSAALEIQTKWRGRIARKWMHRERKRWKKAARSLHAEVFSNWFDNTDRYVHDHEDAEWKWPYEQSEEWRGNIHAAYLAGKELRNKRYALLQQRLAAGPSAEAHRSDTRGSSKRGMSKRQNSSNQASRKTSRQASTAHSRGRATDVQAGKSKQTQRVYSSVQGILRTLVQRGIFEETGLPVDTGGLRKISQNQTGQAGGSRSSLSDLHLKKVLVAPRAHSTLPWSEGTGQPPSGLVMPRAASAPPTDEHGDFYGEAGAGDTAGAGAPGGAAVGVRGAQQLRREAWHAETAGAGE